jgi:hypothetical protein
MEATSRYAAIRSAAIPPISMSRSTTHCSDRTVRARWHPESYGLRDRCITFRGSLQKRKKAYCRASADL